MLSKEITGVDFWQDMTFEEAKAIAAEKKVPVENTTLKLVTLSMPSLKNLSKKPLIQPTFVYGHPVAVSPLCEEKS